MKKLRDWWGLLWPILPLLAGLAILLGLREIMPSAGMPDFARLPSRFGGSRAAAVDVPFSQPHRRLSDPVDGGGSG